MNQFRIDEKFELVLLLLRKRSHGRELSKLAGIPLSTLQRNLRELETLSVVDYSTEGKNKVYGLKRTLQSKAYVHMAEHYKLTKLLDAYPLLRPILEDVSSKVSGMALLFGSYAKFSAKGDSDIDLYVHTNSAKIKRDIELLHSRLSVKIGELSKEDPLSKEIMAHHVILKGADEYYEAFPY
jgi:predicted nucleotidyltransferase